MHGQPRLDGLQDRHAVGHVAQRRLAAAPPAGPPEHRADAARHEQVRHGHDLGLTQAQDRGVPPDQGGGAAGPAGPGQRAGQQQPDQKVLHPHVRPGQLEIELG
jgi:hypothetical protein